MQREFFFDELGYPKRTDLLLRPRGVTPRPNDDWLVEIDTAYLLQDGHPMVLQHYQIKHNDVGAFSAKELQAVLTIRSGDHLIAFPTEKRVE